MSVQSLSSWKKISLSVGAVAVAGVIFAGCNKLSTSTTDNSTTTTAPEASTAPAASVAPSSSAAPAMEQANSTNQNLSTDDSIQAESDSLNKLDQSSTNIDQGLNDKSIQVN